MVDPPSALLTNSQRTYVAGNHEHGNVTHERQQRSRIRKRVFAGIEGDGPLLAAMDPELRRDIFREWEGRQHNSLPNGVTVPDPDGADFARHHFEAGLKGLLEFVYLGVEDAGISDFESLLSDAINRAVREHGKYVKGIDIEFGDLLTYDELRSRVSEGDIEFTDLTPKEIRLLLENDDLPSDALTPGRVRTLLDWGVVDPEDIPVRYLDSLDDSGDEKLGTRE